ncbi:MAG: hypothetical protein ACR2HP_12150 [Ilumatobacteraceae bacterium]
MPLPALALDANSSLWVGEVQFGQQHSALVADRVLVDEADAGLTEDAAGDPLEPAARQTLVDALAEQHEETGWAGPAALPPRLGGGAQLVCGDTHPECAVQCSRRRSDADFWCEKGQRRRHVQHRDRPEVRDTPIDGTSGVVRARTERSVQGGVALADDVDWRCVGDSPGPIEPVEAVKSRC